MTPVCTDCAPAVIGDALLEAVERRRADREVQWISLAELDALRSVRRWRSADDEADGPPF
jgi:hypothetical protein